MTCSLSEDLRFRVISAVEAGSSCRAAAARFGVGTSSAVRWVQACRVEPNLSKIHIVVHFRTA